MTRRERVTGRRIGILGMARSGMAAAELARRFGGFPFVSDGAPETKVADQVKALNNLSIPFETGKHTERLLEVDYLVLSPGVSLEIEILQKARAKGIPIFSELEFASWQCPGRMIAITGSNGKTTTTTLVGEIIKAAGFDTHVCGNIGLPLSAVVTNMSEASIAVVEVSSFQLSTIADFAPHVAAILNLSPDHLDWHGGYEQYKKAKYRITENQRPTDYFITNREDADTEQDDPSTRATRIYFSSRDDRTADAFVRDGNLCVRQNQHFVPILPVKEILIPGPHNLQNAAAAACMVSVFGVQPSVIAQVLKTFKGVEHRLEPVGRVAGISFVNDSKATNVDSVVYALRSIETPIILLMGGRDKGGSYQPVADAGRGKIKNIIAIGEARQKIFESLGKQIPTEFASSLEDAVRRAFEIAKPGETVLLSPGCSSFDMFENFEHRGRVFKDAVATLKNGKRTGETVTS